MNLGNLAGLLGALAFLAAGAIMIARGIGYRREQLSARIALAQLHWPMVQEPPGLHGETDRFSGFPMQTLSRESREIVRRLTPLGLSPGAALAFYRIARAILAILVGLAALIAALKLVPPPSTVRIGLLAGLAATLVAWMAPSIVLAREIKGHAAKAVAGLPDALDLLVVCVEAGLSLDDGLDRVVLELRHSQPALAAELALTSADWKILPSREQALANLAERVNAPSVHSLVTTLSQTLRYGTPLVQALRSVAADLRDDALLRIEERANQLPVLLTIPMMLFVMPTIFLIVAGPAALRVLDIFVHGRMFLY